MTHAAWALQSHDLSGEGIKLWITYILYVTHAVRALQSHDLSGEGIKLWITDILYVTTQGHGGPPRMSDQPYAGATSETAQT